MFWAFNAEDYMQDCRHMLGVKVAEKTAIV